MRFKRKKPRVVWLKPTGTVFAQGVEPFEQLGAIVFSSSVTIGNGAIPTLEVPLVIDNPPDETFAGASFNAYQRTALNQQIEWGYRLRRIVGSIHVSALGTTTDPQGIIFPGVLVTAALIVRRVDADTGTAIAPGNEVNPQLIANWTDPWIWRRTWVLSGFPGTPGNFVGDFGFAAWPLSNAEYGDVRSGPHVDAKTARRVGPEERLFLDLSIQGLGLQPSVSTTEEKLLKVVADLRCLATLSPNSGNRRNASR